MLHSVNLTFITFIAFPFIARKHFVYLSGTFYSAAPKSNPIILLLKLKMHVRFCPNTHVYIEFT